MTITQKINTAAENLQSSLYDPPVRQMAKKLADVIVQEADPVPVLIEILLSSDDWAVLRVLDLLAELQDARTLPALLHILAYETHQQPFDVQLETLRHGEDVRGAVAFAEHMGGDVAEMRLRSISVLGAIGHPDAVGGLIAVLNDDREEYTIKNATSHALEQIGTPEALEATSRFKLMVTAQTSQTKGVRPRFRFDLRKVSWKDNHTGEG